MSESKLTDKPVACRIKRYGEIQSGVWAWSEWMLFQIPEMIETKSTPTMIIEPLYTEQRQNDSALP